MNIRFKNRYFVLLLCLTTFFSCKKDDTATPTPPEEKPTLFSQVQGKWNAEVEIARISNPSLRQLKPSLKVQDIPRVTSVEFFSDSTYILVFNYYSAYRDKFSAEDSSTISFAGFGNLSNIKVTGDSISFNCSYDEVPLTVKAKKATDLTIAQDKKSLLKQWVVTREEDGEAFYSDSENDTDSTQIDFQFTASGTFAYKMNQGSESQLMVLNWKWDPENQNSLVLYMGTDANPYYYGVTIKIVEISDSILRIQLTNGDDDTYDLKLVKK